VGGLVVPPPIGYSAFASGPDKHFIDVLGLADPLMARIPMRPDEAFRPGHFFRPIPAGYVETIRTGRNVIEDPDLRAYYAAISDITRGPLLSWHRLRLVVSFNMGNYDHHLDAYAARNGLRQ
jgi:arabinofuranosyltransferase